MARAGQLISINSYSLSMGQEQGDSGTGRQRDRTWEQWGLGQGSWAGYGHNVGSCSRDHDMAMVVLAMPHRLSDECLDLYRERGSLLFCCRPLGLCTGSIIILQFFM